MKLLSAVAIPALMGAGIWAAPNASAADCQFPVVVIAIDATVDMTCGDGNSAIINHSTNISPSLQVDPHLFTPAP